MIDAPGCFPGMEGSLVVAAPWGGDPGAQQSHSQSSRQPTRQPQQPAVPLAVLIRPLTRKRDGVQVLLAVAWKELATGLSDLLGRVELMDPVRPAGAAGDAMGASCRAKETISSLREDGAVRGSSGRSFPPDSSDHHRSLQRTQEVSPVTPPPPVRGGDGGGGCLSTADGGALSPVQAASRGVVMIRTGGQWATGVVASAESGIILTNAHLLNGGSLPMTHDERSDAGHLFGDYPRAPISDRTFGGSMGDELLLGPCRQQYEGGTSQSRDTQPISVRLTSICDGSFVWASARLIYSFR